MAIMKLKKHIVKHKNKIVILIIVLYVVFSYTFYYSFKNIANNTNKMFVNFVMDNGNASFVSNKKLPNVLNKTINYLWKIDFTNPETLFNENIIGYTVNDKDEYVDIDSLKKVSSYMTDPYNTNTDNPILYIYNSHQLENYNSDGLSVYGITPNVLMASYILKEKLNRVGIPTIVEDTNLTEFLEINNWDYTNSYRASRVFMIDKKNTYSSLKYYIDIHRDSVRKNISTINIGGKNYARILFVVGKEHDNYKDNLSLANKVNNLFDKEYPGLSRGILEKEGPNVNGIYNQDISSKVMLIEIGGVDNNIDEVINTLNAITDILSTYIKNNEKT
jgi:stage II sporulation protein P